MYLCKSIDSHMANKIIVQDTPITVIKQGTEDYICLTDMLHAKDGDFFVTDWLRNPERELNTF